MTDREIMQQALEKLEFFAHMKSVSEDTTRLITALKAVLAEPVQDGFDQLITEMEADPEGVQALEDGRRWVKEQFYAGAEPVQERKPRHVSYVCPQCHWSLDERKPLTEEEEIQELSQQHKFDSRMEKFVRIIEREHGIGEQQ